MLSKIRAHHWAILIAIVVALIFWLARPRPAGEPPPHGSVGNSPAVPSQNAPNAPPSNAPAGRLSRQAAAAKVAEERRRHDDVAARIHQAQTGAAPQTLDAPYIGARIRELQPLLQECYSLALREHPELQGRLVLSFAIVAEPSLGGVVESLEFVSGDAGVVDPTLRECVRATIETQTFAPPDQGGRVSVTYPFVFAQHK